MARRMPAYVPVAPVAGYPRTVLLRHSTVGPFGDPNRYLSATGGAGGVGFYGSHGSQGLPGLVEFLQRLSLLAYFEPVKKWCEEQGACDVMELVENADDLASALMLPVTKRDELKNGAAVAKAINEKYIDYVASAKQKLKKALSTPVTQTETQRAQTAQAQTAQTVRLGMAVLHAALAPIGEAMERTETDYWDQMEDAAHQKAMEDPTLSRDCEVIKRGSQKEYDYYCHYHIDEHLLRQRNPTDAEIEVKDRALKAAREEIMDQWGPDDDYQTAAKTSKHAAFDEMRQQFLEQYAGNLHSELGKGYKLTPAEVAPGIKEKFMKEQKETLAVPDYGYHGTKVANIPSILSTGLKVPGQNSGVRVANGSAHGVGIYTGMPGNLWLSKGFSDTSNMLICGVLDPDAPPRPRVAVPTTKAATVTAPALKSGHRNHHRPAAPVVAAAPAPVYTCTEFRKTDEIKVIGGARVIFKEERVAPLFIAQPANSSETFSPHPVHAKAASRGGSKGQVYIPETGEVVWDCWEAVRCTETRRLKRRLVTKERQQQRQSLRLLKSTEQETFGEYSSP